MVKQEHLINSDLLKFPQVRLVGIDNSGVCSSKDALALAEEMELDLICISMNTSPVVCRIENYEKFLYNLKKNKKKQPVTEVKELRFTPTIGENDIKVKVKHAKEFLSKGMKVKLTMFFSGREITYKAQGEQVINNVVEQLSGISKVEQSTKQEGRRLFTILSPKK